MALKTTYCHVKKKSIVGTLFGFDHIWNLISNRTIALYFYLKQQPVSSDPKIGLSTLFLEIVRLSFDDRFVIIASCV